MLSHTEAARSERHSACRTQETRPKQCPAKACGQQFQLRTDQPRRHLRVCRSAGATAEYVRRYVVNFFAVLVHNMRAGRPRVCAENDLSCGIQAQTAGNENPEAPN